MARAALSNTLRIIGGHWRGRKIDFLPLAGLRPTPDRVRETLFNWLAPNIIGACCLDLFAGSGALGFEALSRGAAHVVMVDSALAVIKQLQKNAQKLQAEALHCYQFTMPQQGTALVAAAQQWQRQFDIVFLDPPFQSGLLEPTLHWLETSGLLTERALIYLETAKNFALPALPQAWEIKRQKTAGQVAYYLMMRQACPG